MGAFGPDMFELFDDRVRRTERPFTDAERQLRRDEPSSQVRWSFSFDGWRPADVDVEYVLA